LFGRSLVMMLPMSLASDSQHGMKFHQRGQLHFGIARLLSVAILCEVVVFGQSAEHHHDGASVNSVEGEVSLVEGSTSIGNIQRSNSAGVNDHPSSNIHSETHNCHVHHAVLHTCPGGFLTPRHVLAYVSLGAVASCFSILYLLNCSDARVRSAVYKIISTAISVYCAVLVSAAVMEVLEVVSEMINWPIDMVFGCLIFAAVQYLVSAMCWSFQKHRHWLMAIEKLGGHLLAFAGIVVFGNILFSCWLDTIFTPYEGHAHKHSHIKYVVVTFLVSLGLGLFFAGKDKLRDTLYRYKTYLPVDLEVHGRQNHTWFENVAKAEHEVLVLIVGFLVMQNLSVWITDKEARLHVNLCKNDVDLYHTAKLFLGGLGLVIVSVVLRCETPRFMRFIAQVMALSGSYCIERSSQWLMTYLLNDVELAPLASASFFTTATVAWVVIMSRSNIRFLLGDAKERAIEDLLEAIAVSVGLAWDHAFLVCQTVLVKHYDETYQLDSACSRVVMAIILCAWVLPGWMSYILPAAQKKLEGHEEDIERQRQQTLQWEEDTESPPEPYSTDLEAEVVE